MIWGFGKTPLDRFLRWFIPMWNDTILPLFKQKAGRFIQTIKFVDQIPRKGLVVKDMSEDCQHNPPCSPAQRAINHPEDEEESSFISEEQFKNRLRQAGWSERDIQQEWEDIQGDDESGYDGP